MLAGQKSGQNPNFGQTEEDFRTIQLGFNYDLVSPSTDQGSEVKAPFSFLFFLIGWIRPHLGHSTHT